MVPDFVSDLSQHDPGQVIFSEHKGTGHTAQLNSVGWNTTR